LSITVKYKLPSLKKADKFFKSGMDKVISEIAWDTVDEISTKFLQGKTGAGRNMPELNSSYQTMKMKKYGRGKRDLTKTGAMLSEMKPFKSGRRQIITFRGDEYRKARYNQEILNKKGGQKFMTVSKKWVKSMRDYFNEKMAF
jgi:hypothetical protein